MPLTFDDATLDEAARFNARLARAPRFGTRYRFMPLLVQGLLRLSQVSADGKLRRAGLQVETRMVGLEGVQVKVRIIRPRGPVAGVVLDIHGGGWVVGNAPMNDAFNAAFASRCGLAVVSVDYRLAPRAFVHQQMEECLAAARWLLQDGLPEYAGKPIIVVGESAGAQLAAATLQGLSDWPALLARIAGAVLYYGVYDMAGTDSVRRAGPETLVLDGPRMLAGLRRLTPDLDDAGRRQPPLSPLFGDLAGMPPALMIVGSGDPLLDDTLQMAQRWQQVADVELNVAPDAPHGFIHFPTAMARVTLAHAQAWVRQRIAPVSASASHAPRAAGASPGAPR
ncbi:alpha/beta hydrolase [Massilia aurea]|uniref:alpha/beta hydrolase n=1 Tax=Massilia aurea TaxID=373040 RepID=UPI002161AA1A|nr:alpha/beta hydrolase [Massilia aurea]MCS0709075.1 alpha/beta hydrolase [Massilia aurea]